MPRVVATRSIHRGWNRLDCVTVETGESGCRRRIEREVIDHGDAAVVLLVDPDRDVAILVRQWRAPLLVAGVQPYLLEACAGIIDAGETAEAAARREVEEETGLAVGELRSVGSILPSAGTLTERMHLFVAEVTGADRVRPGGGVAHEDEEIEVVEVPLAELFALARAGAIEDAKTLVLVQLLMIERMQAAQVS